MLSVLGSESSLAAPSVYERSSVFYNLESCASILVIYAFYILLSAFSFRPLAPGSFEPIFEPAPRLSIEPISKSDIPDLREVTETPLYIDIIDLVSSAKSFTLFL